MVHGRCFGQILNLWVSLVQLLKALRLPTTPFFMYILAVFNTTRNGAVDFGEFAAAVFALAAPTRQNLIRLAFDLYDFGKYRDVISWWRLFSPALSRGSSSEWLCRLVVVPHSLFDLIVT